MSIKRLSGAGLTTPKSNKLWDQVTFQSGMFALATVNLTSSQSSIVFSGIPANYTHLQVRALYATASAGVLRLNFNGDTAGNYKTHFLYGDGTSPYGSVSSVSPNAINIGYLGASNSFGVTIVDILDYANTNKYTVTRSLDGNDRNGSGDIEFSSGVWLNTAAITSITLSGQFGNLNTNSHFALYGIKVA